MLTVSQGCSFQLPHLFPPMGLSKVTLSRRYAFHSFIVLVLTQAQAKFGISALGVASANVFIDLDTSASLEFQLNAIPNVSTQSGVNIGAVNQASGSANGCVNVGAGLSVDAGAQGSLFGLFNAETKVSLFNQTFELLKVFSVIQKVCRLWVNRLFPVFLEML
jgi:hypothetical protein